MAFPFHFACPITCKRICYCSLGFPPTLRNGHGRNAFRNEVEFVERFLRDPWLFRVCEGSTVQVPVPKVSPPVSNAVDGGDSAVALRKGVNVSVEVEDFTRRFDFGSSLDARNDSAAENQSQINDNVMCRLCFSTVSEGSERARRMLPCRDCGNKYHINCLKTWSQHRDLFHWSSWSCPSCRTCEVCRRTGESNKFKFCKRCDGAIHCYCMQPPHKNVSSGPYLCSKHTKCHSCESRVPGNGSSLRWFLGYTCCDACGRLFTKGNYCPVCLKVYRDSEATPMVCCDVCQHWVHCHCDGISDERYMQFQVDRNLPYTCPTCRGEFYQIRDLQDAVRELWRRKDESDQDLIARLRAAAGLPTQEEFYSISPFSDDDDDIDGSRLRSELRRAKLAMKSVPDSPLNNTKESMKKSLGQIHVKKKGPQLLPPTDSTIAANCEADFVSSKITGSSSPGVKMFSSNEVGSSKEKCVNEIAVNSEERKPPGVHFDSDIGDNGMTTGEEGGAVSKMKTKGTKLVIHLGGRNKTIIDPSSDQRKQELMLNGDRGERNKSHEIYGPKPSECITVKFGTGKPLNSGPKSEPNGVAVLSSPESNTPRISLSRSNGGFATTTGLQKNTSKVEIISSQKRLDHNPDKSGDNLKSSDQSSLVTDNLAKDSRPLLRFKVKTPCSSSWLLQGEKERGVPKGQRSKRKRSEKFKQLEQHGGSELHDKDLMSEIMDASWVLKKLGREAIGKRVEVHQSSDNSWHKGIICDVIEETSVLSIGLDDGRTKTCEVGKQGIRLVAQDKRRKFKIS